MPPEGKVSTYSFLTQSGSYHAPDRERRLEAEVQRLEQEAGDLHRYTDGVRAKDRPLPTVHDVGGYLEVRVRQSQLDGYPSRRHAFCGSGCGN